jgi:hypothetical protein
VRAGDDDGGGGCQTAACVLPRAENLSQNVRPLVLNSVKVGVAAVEIWEKLLEKCFCTKNCFSKMTAEPSKKILLHLLLKI